MSNIKENNKLSLIDAIILCINSMIGVGIFTTPAKLALTVGPAGILTYIIGTTAVLFMALGLALLSKTYPQSGSFYNYTKDWAGKNFAFIIAFSYIIGIVIALGLLLKIAAQYLNFFIPGLSKDFFGLLVIFLITALNIAGVKTMKIGQTILLACTIFSIISIIILCFYNANINNITDFMPYGFKSVIKTIPTAIFSLLGFESAASLYNIVKNPEKNVSRAILFSVLIAGILYILFIISIDLAINRSIFLTSDMTIAQAFVEAFGSNKYILIFSKVINVAILTAVLGVLQSIMYSSASLALSLIQIRYKEFLVLKYINIKILLILIAIISIINFFTINNMGIFFNLTAIFVIFAFAMSLLTLFVKNVTKNFGEKLIMYSGIITSFAVFFSAIYSFLADILN